MSVESHRVLIGAYGWKHPAWNNDFYDEDLPEDWQLGFYANEFPVVYVPASDWLEQAELAEWEEEVTESFRFILDIPSEVINDTSQLSEALKKAHSLGDFCLGLVFHVNQDVMENVSEFKQHLEKATSFTNVCVDKGEHVLTTAFSNLLNDNNISEVWNGISADYEALKRGSLALTRVSANDMDMASLRKVVEVCFSVSSENCISVMCLQGNPPSLEKMRNADIILNLL
jgi:hypothetical protein